MDLSEYFKRHLDLHKAELSKDFKQKTLKDRMDTFKTMRRQTRNTILLQKRQIDKNLTPYKTPDPKNVKSRRKSNASTIMNATLGNTSNKRLEMLAKWKADKEKRLAQDKLKVKPIFKVYHVPETVGLPDLENVNKEIKGKLIKKAEFAPPNHIFKPPANIKPINISQSKKTTTTRLTRQNSTDPLGKKVKSIEASHKKEVKCSPPKRSRITTRQNTENKEKLTKENVSNNNTKSKSTSVDNLANNKGKRNIHKTTSIENLTKNKPSSSIKNNTNKVNSINNSLNRSKSVTEATATNQALKRTPRVTAKKETIPVTSDTVTPRRTRGQAKKSIEVKTPAKEISTKTQSNKKKLPQSKATKWQVAYNGASSEEDSTSANESQGKSSHLSSTSTDYTMDSRLDVTENVTPVKKIEQDEAPPVYISPFVTISRGKNSARKEFHIRNSPGNASPLFQNKDLGQNTSPKAGAEYFSRKLQMEIDRIEVMVHEWQTYRDENGLPTEAHDMIDVAIGQSKLLITKKFEQFRGLVEQCRNCEYIEKPITCKDLHGFWDMMHMQVLDLEKRFNTLKTLKSNNWKEVLPEKKVQAPVKKTRGKATSKSKPSSGLKAMIQALREKKNDKTANNLEVKDDREIMFDGGYFAVKSPIKIPTPAPHSARGERRSLRMSVLSVEAQKQISSPGFTMMKITQAIKYGDGITPSKSILKTEGCKSAKKSVLFKEDISFEKIRAQSLSKSVLFQKDEEVNDENDFNQTNLSPSTVTRRSSRLNRNKL